jgi:NAD(P)-dependent dehydrogenase (short-subunit alcohol dehydrogenase family)
MSVANFSLKGRTAVVTGGAGILGPRFCAALAAHGATVAVVDVNSAKATEVAADLAERYQVRSQGFACDVTNKQSVDEVVKQVVAQFGPIHILHNNAASKGKNLDDFFAPFEEFKLEAWRDIMGVNVDGMFLVAQAVGKSMLTHQIKGSIIQTASIYGVVAPDQRIYEGSHYMDRQISSPAVYSASKAAVIGLTKYLASYWGAKGIRVNTLTPGGVESGQNDVFRKKYSARVPLDRMAEADELGGALVFLASDASSYVTGQNLIVDGGLSAW